MAETPTPTSTTPTSTTPTSTTPTPTPPPPPPPPHSEDSNDTHDSVAELALLFEGVQTICCIGCGRVGLVSMAILAHYWPNKHFVLLDKNVEKINNLNGFNNTNQRILPFREPEMEQYVTAGINAGNLHFSFNIAYQLDQCQMIFVAVDLPLKLKPKIIKHDLDTKDLEDALKCIVQSSQRQTHRKFVAVKSTMPVDYNSQMLNYITSFQGSDNLSIAINPEFFSSGTAVQDLLHPRSIILGSFFYGADAIYLFRWLYEGVVDADNIQIILSSNAAQMGKLLSNAMLAANLAILNIGSTLCDKIGSNVDDVKETIGSNPRINGLFLKSRAGYGGIGLTRAIKYLTYLCDHVGLTSEKKLFNVLNEMRTRKLDELVQTIAHKIGDSKDVAVYGFSTKVNTDDIRESPALYICQSLLKISGMQLKVYDPWVSRNAVIGCFTTRQKERLTVVDDVKGGWEVNAILFLVEWPQFIAMMAEDREELVNTMRKPSVILDCCDLIDVDDNDGFEGVVVYRLGKPKTT